MTAEELESSIESGVPLTILDVRSGFEFESGHIQGAFHAPLMNLLKTAQRVSENKEDLFVIICEHGPRAQLGKVLLKMAGYKQLELLDGHMSHWRQTGRPVKKGQS